MLKRLKLAALSAAFFLAPFSIELALAQNTVAATSPVAAMLTETSALDEVNAALSNDGEVSIIVEFNVKFEESSYQTGLEAAGGNDDVNGLQVDGVQFERVAKPGAFQARVASLQDALVSKVSRNIGGNLERMKIKRMSSLPMVAMTVNAVELAEIANDPSVKHIQLDRADSFDLADSVPLIGMDNVYPRGGNGDNQIVAVLDTGVDYAQTFHFVELASCFSTRNLLLQRIPLCPNGGTSQLGGSAGEDCSGVSGCDHGTHVAGIAAGKRASGSPRNGVARNASVWSMQVFTRHNRASDCSPRAAPCVLAYVSDQIKALDRILATTDANGKRRPGFAAAGKKIGAVNMSLGGGTFTGFCDTDSRKTAIDALRAKNIATVISSGNGSQRNAVGAPGCISSAMTVGNTTKTDQVWNSSNVASMVDFHAPGRSIISSLPGTAFGSKTGTSMSAPHVAGAFAVLHDLFPSATETQIEQALENTGLPVRDQRSGGTITKPRIRVDRACIALGGSCTPPVGRLTLSPTTGFETTGRQFIGGFSPTAKNYTVRNTGGQRISWTASENLAGLSLTPSSGALNPGQSTIVRVFVNTAARNLSPATYNGTLSVRNTTNSLGNTSRSLRMIVRPALSTTILSAVLPYARSTKIGGVVTAFGTIINTGRQTAYQCRIGLPRGVNAAFQYRPTDANNRPIGTLNKPVDIPAGKSQGFVFGVTPRGAMSSSDIKLIFDCGNTAPAPVRVGLNTFMVSAETTATMDAIAISSTPATPGVVDIPGNTGSSFFATAAVNIGEAGPVVVSVDTNGVRIPVSATLCRTNPTTGRCTTPIGKTVTTRMGKNEVGTFSIFVKGNGAIPFAPDKNRLFLWLKQGAATRGATSVAVRTVGSPS